MAGESGGVGIGARLRAARERKAFTVLQAAEKLHVDARILESLEAENFTSLGADVYVRGHLRRYAELVGESSSQLQDLYANAGPRARPDLTRIPRGTRSARSSALLLPAVLLVSGFALAGLLWWLLTLPGAKPHVMPQSVPAVASQPPSESNLAPPPPEGASTASSTGAAASGAVQLALRFSASSWTQIRDAQGHMLLDGLMPAGTVRTVSGAAPLRIVLGNAAGVALEMDGRTLALGGLVRRRGDAHVIISAAGEVSAAAPMANPGA